MKSVWILEDSGRHCEELKKIVSSCGFNPVSFNARNPFLKAYFGEENKANVYGMILDNQVPIFDEVGCHPKEGVGVGIIHRLAGKGLLENLNIALYTSDEMNPEIEEVCGMGAVYYSKNNGPGWIEGFLGI